MVFLSVLMVFLSVLMIFLSLYQRFNTILTIRMNIFCIFATPYHGNMKKLIINNLNHF